MLLVQIAMNFSKKSFSLGVRFNHKINLILTKYTTVGKSNRQDFKQTLIKKCKHIEQGNYQYLLTALGLYKKEIKPYPQPEKFEIIL